MKSLFYIIFFLAFLSANAQATYSELVQEAMKTMNTSKDTTTYKKALSIFEKAFDKFPDSITDTELYYSSIIAADLKENDKAFKYLIPLSELIEDEEGYPGWDYVVGEYADEDYKNIQNDKRWEKLKTKALKRKTKFFSNLKKSKEEFFNTLKIDFPETLKNEALFKFLKEFKPYIAKQQQNYSITFKINDSLKTSYYVHLPLNYTVKKEYPVLIFLHGAVRHTKLSDFETKSNLKYWNRYYTKYADENNVVLIFPKGNKHYNWMTSDAGFFIVPSIVKQLKKAININDNKIFISGHSNGATGAFSYLMKQPNLFAGFYGFNTEPKVYTGGTFIENTLNRSFINFSTDQDYYYPPNANDSLVKLMKSIKADYKDYRYNGYPHWFPQFDASEPAYKILFSDLMKRKRNPLPKKITWEFDDNDYGNIDWLTNIKLDTIQKKSQWHKNLNFDIKKWLVNGKNNNLIAKDVNKKSFDFPRKSGKIIATYHDNTFKVQTSRIKSFQIKISPEMINLKKKLIIYINGKCYFKKKVKYDRELMLQYFKRNLDRERIWINSIKLTI
ncbi:alpha/beta hydrolase-fold protein [Tenacibaculum sp. 1_MG-2023]|uniref:alpha/beta hydrolase-fold protein n=1 Tax=Tenacibaculum sp. 1_MG-2023 TaxID=3062653 RepID=UPI0026E33C4E|nr:alpha/beta hydrolase-fold protein [Tenacibaculum sp. 1_MG-2023]MDO6676714.1 alpha/beta hydrolase-fold protein [Tenacibaculum sp. 1_MG-2023]